MSASNFLKVFVLLAVTAASQDAPAAPLASPKKGVGTWAFAGSQQALTDVQASWFYNWNPGLAGVEAPPGMQFVPMIWGRDATAAESLAQAKDAPILLGFNEPDHEEQSNLTVEEALALWPKLQSTGAKRLGSPATANDPRLPSSWLHNFMAGAKAKGLRVDFICVHRYVDVFDPALATDGGAAKQGGFVGRAKVKSRRRFGICLV